MRYAAIAAALVVVAPDSAMADQNDPRLGALFEALAAAESSRDAAPFEQAVWELWTRSGDDAVDTDLAAGIRAMNGGDGRAALAAFDRVVTAAPEFAEGWNKRATLYWLLGDHDASSADIERTLALEPRHFGALSGLALIREAQGRPFEALEALHKVLALHPRMPQLEQRIEQLTAQLGVAI